MGALEDQCIECQEYDEIFLGNVWGLGSVL